MQNRVEADRDRDGWTLDADIRASLALSRATLLALTTAYPCLGPSADAALESEIEAARTYLQPSGQRVVDILMGTRQQLQQALDNRPREKALEEALIRAAADLPQPPGLRVTG
jgi:hypothetical protein